jgi:hypothetical protein
VAGGGDGGAGRRRRLGEGDRMAVGRRGEPAARGAGLRHREWEERKKKKEAGREVYFPSLPSARDLALGKDFLFLK